MMPLSNAPHSRWLNGKAVNLGKNVCNIVRGDHPVGADRVGLIAHQHEHPAVLPYDDTDAIGCVLSADFLLEGATAFLLQCV